MTVTRRSSRSAATKDAVSRGRVTKKPPSSKSKRQTSSPANYTSEEGPNYYLVKSEPESRIQKGVDMKFSIDDLASMPDQTDHWDGVRNHEAKNFMRSMKLGDQAFFYHSNCKEPGIVGIVKVVREAYPDFTAWDRTDPHFDPKSTKENPRWWMVDVKLAKKFESMVSLKTIKKCEELKDMFLVKRGRISVQPVRKKEWDFIIKLADDFAKKKNDAK